MTRSQANDWISLPDHVAMLLGRLTFLAAWVDDILGEAVVLGNPDADHLAESTQDWAQSGQRLVSAIRDIAFDPSVTAKVADELQRLAEFRNVLIHGVWLWQDDQVMILKRALGGGERHYDYATLSYAMIARIAEDYQRLGRVADALVAHLKSSGRRPWEDGYVCPNDGTPLSGVVRDETIVQTCGECGFSTSAEPHRP